MTTQSTGRSVVVSPWRRYGLFGLLIMVPLQSVYLYFAGNWYTIGHAYSISMLFGIISYSSFCCTLILSTRVRILDRQFGHDKVLRFHGYLASLSILTGAIHCIMKSGYLEAIAFQEAAGMTSLAIALVIALLTVMFMAGGVLSGASFYSPLREYISRRVPLDYSRAKLLHNGFSLVVALLVLHILLADSTRESLMRSTFMGALGGGALLWYFYHKILRPLFNMKRGFYLARLEKPASKIVRLTFRSGSGKRFTFLPGQFAYLRTSAPGTGNEEHPFSLSSSPAEPDLQMTIKTIGDYTSRLGNFNEGAPVMLDGPYGAFTPRTDDRNKVFIAGGIGITPFLSILSSWRSLNQAPKTTLFWSAGREDDLVDAPLFEKMTKECPWFTFVPMLTKEHSGKFRQGRITPDLLVDTLGSENLAETDFYICGPVAMIRHLQQILRSKRVMNRNIHCELFSF